MNKTEEFLKSLEDNCGDLGAACKQVGVSRKQVMDLAKTNEAFQYRIWEIKENLIDLGVSTQFKLGIAGDSKMLSSWLDVHAKQRGYGKEEQNNKDVYPGIRKPEEENTEEKIVRQVKDTSTESLEITLKKLKRIKI